MSEQLHFFDDFEEEDLNARIPDNSVGSESLSAIRDCKTCLGYAAEVSKAWARFREAYFEAKSKKTHIKGVWHA